MDYTALRRYSRQVSVGGVLIGGSSAVSVQTMTSKPAGDIDGTIEQIYQAAGEGCDIVRVAIPSLKDVVYFQEVCKISPLPVVGDIHFDARIAVAAIEAGAAKIRINPGNMENWEAINQILDAAKKAGVPIRIGVNGGSVKHKNKDDSRGMEEAVVEEALEYASRFEDYGFSDIVISAKISDALSTIRVNREIAARCDYPLHIGVTEAGVEEDAMLKSAIGIGGLLADGIGDTIRLSFTGEPVREVIAGKRLLRAAGILRDGVEIISCPTCGRCRISDMAGLAREVKQRLEGIKLPIKVAVMGCEVNGPGEAEGADIGVAGSGSGVLLFAKGEKLGVYSRAEAMDRLMVIVESMG